jgi:hypothetical protein
VLGVHALAQRTAPRRLLQPLVCGGAVLLAAVAAFELGSGGAWWTNLVAGSGQELRWERGVEQVVSRLPYLGLPQVLVFVAARRLGHPNRYALGALASSTVWTVLTMAKSGSTTNYWIEPTLAALVVLATTETCAAVAAAAAFPAEDRFGRAAALGASVLALASAATTLPAIARMAAEARQNARSLREVRAWCTLAPGEMAIGGDPGVEYELSGRLATTPFEMTYLSRRGLFPLSTWAADLARPSVRWFVTHGDPLHEEPPRTPEERRETLAFFLELRDQILEDFSFDRRIGDFWIYRRRGPVAPRSSAPPPG